MTVRAWFGLAAAVSAVFVGASILAGDWLFAGFFLVTGLTACLVIVVVTLWPRRRRVRPAGSSAAGIKGPDAHAAGVRSTVLCRRTYAESDTTG